MGASELEGKHKKLILEFPIKIKPLTQLNNNIFCSFSLPLSHSLSPLLDKMRQKDLEQAILFEEKLALHISLLAETQNTSDASIQIPGADAFLSNFGSYRDLVTDDCDTSELWKRVLHSIQEISHIASTLYTAATGLPLARSLSSVGERQSDAFISPTLPKRAETFGGFDERRSKGILPWRCEPPQIPPSPQQQRDIDVIYSSSDMTKTSCENLSIREHRYAALQATHDLQLLLSIIWQQMTTISSLQIQLMGCRENPKALYRHNDQLEELRNLQDKLQEEKTSWQKQREQQEKDLEERRVQQQNLQQQIKAEQEDIKQQREQLYRKMEMLSSQGIVLLPNTALPVPLVSSTLNLSEDVDEHFGGDYGERRKDKWKTATSKFFFSFFLFFNLLSIFLSASLGNKIFRRHSLNFRKKD